MRCEEVRDLASAWLDGALSERLSGGLAEHLEGCDDCRALIADLRADSALVSRLGREPAPPGLAERIRDAVAHEAVPAAARPRWHGFAVQAAAMAACCLLSVFGTWSAMRTPGAGALASHDAVAAHVRSLLQDSPFQVASTDSHTVRPWFNGKVEFAPPVKDLAAEGFALAGGRLDYVDGRRVAALVYRRRLHTISLFVWPEEAPGSVVERQTSGLNVLSWHKDGMVWWAVSDLNPEELRELRALL